MYIEICKDIIEDAIAKSGQEVNISLDLLQLFAMFSSKGNHIFFVPCLLYDETLTKKLVSVMGISSIKKLKRANEKFYVLQRIKSVLSRYCIVTYSDNNKQDDRVIVYNPTRMQQFEPFLRTKLITENLLDAVFFDYIAHFYLREERLSGVVKIIYEATPGGGSTTCDVLKHEILENRRFCLVIVDGDKKYPKQIECGDTAKKIIKVISQYPSALCKHYIMEKVMEVENLIPKRIVKEYASEKIDCDVLDRDVSFFDMKIGLTLKGLYNDDVFHYQSKIFPELDYAQRNEAKCKTTREEYERYIDDNHLTNVLKQGFGSDLLRIVTCACDDKGKIRYPELEDEMKNKITSEDLTAEQLEEWSHIGQLMLSWMCCLPPKYY